MKRPADRLGAAVRAYRELTARATEGDATRARVLADADHTDRTPGVRRIWIATSALVLIMAASAAAARPGLTPWRPAPIAIAWSPPHPREPGGARRRTLVIPSEAPEADDDSPEVTEAATYARAHRAHFVTGRPAAALLAWDAYLHNFPRGAFAPEARFNRALCLIRLGRWADADRALASFAEARSGSYRREEAIQLRDWLASRVQPSTALSDAPGR